MGVTGVLLESASGGEDGGQTGEMKTVVGNWGQAGEAEEAAGGCAAACGGGAAAHAVTFRSDKEVEGGVRDGGSGRRREMGWKRERGERRGGREREEGATPHKIGEAEGHRTLLIRS